MTRTTVLAALAMMAMSGTARAGSIMGSWGPISGYGEVLYYETQQATFFTSTGGELTISYSYDPSVDYEPTGFVALSTGSAGYSFSASQDLQEGVFDDVISFSATYGLGGSVWALFYGDPSNVASWQLFAAGAGPPYHGIDGGLEISFYGGLVPEPSSGLLLAAGLAGVGLLGRRRRARPA